MNLFLILWIGLLNAKTVFINVPWWTTGPIYVTGSSQALCQWKPNCQRLKQVAPLTYSFESNELDLEFKVTRGTWETEATKSNGIRFPNFDLASQKETQFISIENWADLPGLSATSAIEEFDLYSPELKRDKKIRILLPKSYQLNTKKRYPVIYAQDGQNLFDSSVGNFGMEWAFDEAITKLVNEKAIPEVIVVGIDSNEFRTREYNFPLEGQQYADFLSDTLKKHVDSKYRTLSSRENTFLMGSSYGAIISFETLWFHSEVFSRAACLSFPAQATNSYVFDFIDQQKLQNPEVYFYLDHGMIGSDAGYFQHTSLFVTKLREQGFNRDRLTYNLFPYADHREVDWARRLPEVLKNLLLQ